MEAAAFTHPSPSSPLPPPAAQTVHLLGTIFSGGLIHIWCSINYSVCLHVMNEGIDGTDEYYISGFRYTFDDNEGISSDLLILSPSISDLREVKGHPALY